MSQDNNSAHTLGAILIIIGSVFLIDNMDILPFDIRVFFFKWQVILIIIGTVMLLRKPEKNTGLLLIAIGGFFLLPEFHLFEEIEMRTWWPLALVGLGIFVIMNQQEKAKRIENDSKKEEDNK